MELTSRRRVFVWVCVNSCIAVTRYPKWGITVSVRQTAARPVQSSCIEGRCVNRAECKLEVLAVGCRLWMCEREEGIPVRSDSEVMTAGACPGVCLRTVGRCCCGPGRCSSLSPASLSRSRSRFLLSPLPPWTSSPLHFLVSFSYLCHSKLPAFTHTGL